MHQMAPLRQAQFALVAVTAIASFGALTESAHAKPNRTTPRAHAASGPVVHAPSGAVRGTAEGNLHIFRGIPYARPPVGSLRWRPPLPIARWPGVREATEF